MEQFELPEGWEWRALRDVCIPVINWNQRREPREAFRYIEISSIDNTQGVILEPRFVSGKMVPSRAKQIIHTGDVLFGTTRPYLKNIAVVTALLDNEICSTGFCVLRPSNELVTTEWLFHACRSDLVIEQVISGQEKSTYPAVNDSEVLEAVIPIPPLPEQNRLVARIEAFAERFEISRKVQGEAIADMEGMFERALHLVFSEDNTTNWSEYPTTALFSMVSGQVNPRQKSYINMPSVAPDNVEKGTGRLIGEIKTAGELELSSGKYLFGLEHVIYSKIRPALRKVCVPRFAGVCSAHMYALKPNTNLISQDFLALSLLSPPFTSYAVDNSGRNAMPKINRKVLFSYRMRVPDLLMQERLSTYLLGIRERSDEIAGLQRSVEVDLAALMPAILAKAFRGEL